MIPFFKNKGSLEALEKAYKSGFVKKSEVSKGVLEDLINYDKSFFFFYKKHEFKFIE